MKKFTKALLIFCILLLIGGTGCVIGGFLTGIRSDEINQLVKDFIPYMNYESGYEIITEEEMIEIFEEDDFLDIDPEDE